MEVLSAAHGVCEIASLETWCLYMSQSLWGSRLCTAGRISGSDLGGDDLSVSWLCLFPSTASLSISYSFSPMIFCLSLPASLFYTYFFSLCPSLSLFPWLLPSWNEVGRQEDPMEDTGALRYSCHSSLSFSLAPLKSLSLSSLPLCLTNLKKHPLSHAAAGNSGTYLEASMIGYFHISDVLTGKIYGWLAGDVKVWPCIAYSRSDPLKRI